MNITEAILKRLERLEDEQERYKTYGKPIHVPWTDYTSTATVNGWSSFATKQIWYCRLANIVFVAFELEGTSNNIGSNFSLPYTIHSRGSMVFGISAQDNSGAWHDGMGAPTIGYAYIVLYNDWAGAAWTASGNKRAAGIFWYWCT